MSKMKRTRVHWNLESIFMHPILSLGLTALKANCFYSKQKPLSRGISLKQGKSDTLLTSGLSFISANSTSPRSPLVTLEYTSSLSASHGYFFPFNSRRNFSATVRRDLIRAKYLSLASTSVQGESGVLVFNNISSAAVM